MAYFKSLFGAALAAAFLSSPSAAASSGKGDRSSKVVCRESVPVGSVVAKQLICMSGSAWNKGLGERRDADDYSTEFLRLKEPARPDMMQLGQANWATLPQLKARGKVPYLQLVRQTRELLRSGACAIPGQTAKKFDILINYGVQFDASGQVSRVLVEDTQCNSINAMIGMAVLARAERGDFNLAGGTAKGWHADRINLTLQ